MNPTRVDEDFELVICCLCEGGHQPIKITFNLKGNPKTIRTRKSILIEGNTSCWYGLFEFLTKDLIDKNKKLVQNWNFKKREFGSQNRSKKVMQGCINTWCRVCGVEERLSMYNNAIKRFNGAEVGEQHMVPEELHHPQRVD